MVTEMAKAIVKGAAWEVRVCKDLGEDNFAVEVVPPRPPRKVEVFKALPASLLIKVKADNLEVATKAGLDLLLQLKRIDSYDLGPQATPAPAPTEPAVKAS